MILSAEFWKLLLVDLDKFACVKEQAFDHQHRCVESKAAALGNETPVDAEIINKINYDCEMRWI